METMNRAGRLGGRLLTRAQVAERLGCSVSTIQRRVDDGTIPAIRIKGLLRFRPEVIDALLQVVESGGPGLVSEEG
ncbi:MAG TPA: helix-turn-helix domain-containing protein [Anaeromyxobacteraceae bacterium]|nr:helix-turn-helix domain-containing protein [Anaeromyxobacteraceae bacterium]